MEHPLTTPLSTRTPRPRGRRMTTQIPIAWQPGIEPATSTSRLPLIGEFYFGEAQFAMIRQLWNADLLGVARKHNTQRWGPMWRAEEPNQHS